MSEPFSASDSWLLLSLVYATVEKPGATLSDILGASYLVRRSVPLRSELEGGMRRLVAAGLVQVAEREFIPSAVAREWWNECMSIGLSATVAQAQLANRMGAPALQVGPIPRDEEQWYFSEEEYEAGLAEYVAASRAGGIR